MKRALRILGYLVVLAIGLVAGRVWGTFNDYSQLWGQVADRDSHEAMMRVDVLSQLRLGRIDDAIESLELPLGNQVLMIAHGDTLFKDSPLELDPQSMSPFRLRALQFVKAYHSLYPPGPNASQPPPGQVLARVPDLVCRPDSKCGNPLFALLKDQSKNREEKASE